MFAIVIVNCLGELNVIRLFVLTVLIRNEEFNQIQLWNDNIAQ